MQWYHMLIIIVVLCAMIVFLLVPSKPKELIGARLSMQDAEAEREYLEALLNEARYIKPIYSINVIESDTDPAMEPRNMRY